MNFANKQLFQYILGTIVISHVCSFKISKELSLSSVETQLKQVVLNTRSPHKKV
jgi:hypothetical protein